MKMADFAKKVEGANPTGVDVSFKNAAWGADSTKQGLSQLGSPLSVSAVAKDSPVAGSRAPHNTPVPSSQGMEASNEIDFGIDSVSEKLGGLAVEGTGQANLPPSVNRRIKVLRKLHDKRAEIEDQYREERRKLDAKYRALYEPLYQQRVDIVSGKVEVKPEDVADSDGEDNDNEENQDENQLKQVTGSGKDGQQKGSSAKTAESADLDDVKGIPDFWVTAITNHPQLEELVSERDTEALRFLRDVRCEDYEDMNGFKLDFYFAPNPFFTNSVLTTSYEIPNMMEGGEPMLMGLEGTEIDWAEGKNLTVKKVQKKQRKKGSRNQTRTVTREEPCDSFFKLFSPPPMPFQDEDEEELEEEEEEMAINEIDTALRLALIFREQIVPTAVLWYTGEALEEDSDYEVVDEDESSEEDSEEDSEEESDDAEDDSEEEDQVARGESEAVYPGLASGKGGDEKEPECKNQ